MNITDEQLDDMLHALGKSQTPRREDMGWRNYFSAGRQSESWDDLVEKGLAEQGKNHVYRVSEYGCKILGVTIK